MKFLQSFLVAAVAFTSLVNAIHIVKPREDYKTFLNEVFRAKNASIVKYVNDTDDHYQAFDSNFYDALHQIFGDEHGVQFVEVECNENPQTCVNHHVKETPSLRFFKKCGDIHVGHILSHDVSYQARTKDLSKRIYEFIENADEHCLEAFKYRNNFGRQ